MLDYVLSYSEWSAHLSLNKLNMSTLSLGLTTKLPRYPIFDLSRQDYLAALQDLYDSMSSENIPGSVFAYLTAWEFADDW